MTEPSTRSSSSGRARRSLRTGRRLFIPALAGLLLALFLPFAARAAGPATATVGTSLTPDQKCIAMVAYAEAAGEGERGLRAVIQVIRNRMSDSRFGRSGCDVVKSPGEFQPVGMSPRLRAALDHPANADMAAALADFGVDRDVLARTARLVAAGPDQVASTGTGGADVTAGALFFVNPRLMDPAKCPWFAKLKRTTAIGGHVFMTDYGPDEARGGPALDCAQVARDWAAYQKTAATTSRPSRKRRSINPDWIVPVDHSALAAGGTCSTGTYDPQTRTYSKGDC